MEVSMRFPHQITAVTAVALLTICSVRAAGETPVDRWARAVGGREKVAAVRTIYREATIEVNGLQGTLKVWHTADGSYRKEERVAAFSRIEAFDGAVATVREGDGPVQTLAGADLKRAVSTAFANTNAIFFAFFPERHHGSVAIEGEDSVVMTPEGGINWRVELDHQTWLPKTMKHTEGERTITVVFAKYESVDGLKLEKEIHRSNGNPRFDAVIRFTNTAINPPLEASLFTVAPADLAKE
jgi:hypothetical protein